MAKADTAMAQGQAEGKAEVDGVVLDSCFLDWK